MGKWEENELYATWAQSEPANREEVEAKLCTAIKRHVQAVLVKTLKDVPPDLPELVDATVAATMIQLGDFRQKSKFSTWVEAIARQKAKEYIRGKIRARRVFDENVCVVESDREDDSEPRAEQISPSVLPQLDGEIAVKEFLGTLSNEDASLLGYKEKGLTSKQIAKAMGTSVSAINSRWARLKLHSNILGGPRRKLWGCGN